MTEETTHTEEFLPSPVSVTVDNGNLAVHETAADFGGYQTYVLAGTESPQRILSSDNQRARAYVVVSGTGPIWIGSEGQMRQIKAGAPQTSGMVSGGYIGTGITVPVTHKQEVWMVPDGTHSATVTVVNERWA